MEGQQTPLIQAAQPRPLIVRQDADVARLEHRLSDYFGQAVKIKKNGARKGQLVIDYNSFDELEGVLTRAGFSQQDRN